MMNHQLASVRNQVFKDLSQFFQGNQLEDVKRCAADIKTIFPNQSCLEQNKVLVAYGGGKDSSYLVAFMRMVQLLLFKLNGQTFQMRVMTNRHPGMPKAVMENIHRVYSALELYDDPDLELLLIDGNDINLFDRDLPLPKELINRTRQDILMSGHRTQANSRPTFCNACNISVIKSFGSASYYKGGVNVIITGDSLKEERAYIVWLRHLARKSGLDFRRDHGQFSFKRYIEIIDTLSKGYFQEIYGENAGAEIEEQTVINNTTGFEPLFFSIYNYTDYAAGAHWTFLTEYLKFEFDDLAFSFSESDCANPSLMAHLRGLKCERLYGRSYGEGIDEYVKFGTYLMRQKQFPDFLINEMTERYKTKEAVELMREKVNAFALEAFNITEEQLICMVYSPFADNGKNLEMYLSQEQPQLLSKLKNIRQILDETTNDETLEKFSDLVGELCNLTGLNLNQMRMCYQSPLLGANIADSSSLVNSVLEKDPHKTMIETRHTQNGPIVKDMISGR